MHPIISLDVTNIENMEGAFLSLQKLMFLLISQYDEIKTGCTQYLWPWNVVRNVFGCKGFLLLLISCGLGVSRPQVEQLGDDGRINNRHLGRWPISAGVGAALTIFNTALNETVSR